MKRRHEMPFGAECRADGSVRFRLWAPAARSVDVLIQGSTRLEMRRAQGGWFELITDQASLGSKYFYSINGERQVPDPASRFQPEDVHGPSEVIDPNAFEWKDDGWHGRQWEEAVSYELHVGTFSALGSFSGVRERFDYLVD